MKKLTIVLAALAFAGAATNTAGAADGDTVKAIKARGELLCGVSTGVSTGMSTLDNQGNWKGMEVEFCRGLAAAVLGDPSKVKFVPLDSGLPSPRFSQARPISWREPQPGAIRATRR